MMPIQVRIICQLQAKKPVMSECVLELLKLNTTFLFLHPFCSLSAVEEIVKEIEDFDGLQALRLEGNTIGVEAAKTIAKALETKSELTVFSGPFSASPSA